MPRNRITVHGHRQTEDCRCVSQSRKLCRSRPCSWYLPKLCLCYRSEVPAAWGSVKTSRWISQQTNGRRNGADIGDNRTEDHAEYTLNQLNEELRHRLPTKPRVSNNLIANALHARLVTLKLTRNLPEQRNSEEVKSARKEMAEWLLRNALTEKIYIDESGFRLWLKRNQGRSLRGEKAYRLVNARGSQNFSMVFAVSCETGLLHHSIKEGGFKGWDFKDFL